MNPEPDIWIFSAERNIHTKLDISWKHTQASHTHWHSPLLSNKKSTRNSNIFWLGRQLPGFEVFRSLIGLKKREILIMQSLQGSFLSHPALLLFLLCSSFHAFPHSESFPPSLVGEVTRLSEEGLSLPSLDLGEERVNENSCESSEIKLRVWEWEKEEKGDKVG